MMKNKILEVGKSLLNSMPTNDKEKVLEITSKRPYYLSFEKIEEVNEIETLYNSISLMFFHLKSLSILERVYELFDYKELLSMFSSFATEQLEESTDNYIYTEKTLFFRLIKFTIDNTDTNITGVS